jgi:hypothetical protein
MKASNLNGYRNSGPPPSSFPHLVGFDAAVPHTGSSAEI